MTGQDGRDTEDQHPSAERTISWPSGADRPGNGAFATVGQAGAAGAGAGEPAGGVRHDGHHAKRFARTGVPEADLILEAARALRRTWGEGLAAHDLSPHESRALRVVVAHCHPTPAENGLLRASAASDAPEGVLTEALPAENGLLRASAASDAPEGVLTEAPPAENNPVRDGGPRLADIAAALRIAPRSATEVVDRLVTRGLVERRPSPTDRRAIEVVPTAEGLEASAAVERSWGAAATRFLEPLDPSQREELSALLRLLTEGTR